MNIPYTDIKDRLRDNLKSFPKNYWKMKLKKGFEFYYANENNLREYLEHFYLKSKTEDYFEWEQYLQTLLNLYVGKEKLILSKIISAINYDDMTTVYLLFLKGIRKLQLS